MAEKKVNKLFGEKNLELFRLMDETPNWEQYVSEKTAAVIKYVKESQSMQATMEHFGMKYTTVRAHILKAIDRIKNKKTDFKRGGKSELAQELFRLMDETPNWEQYVTHYEAELAKRFRKVKNFYKLGKELNIAPSNIAGTLYGTTQKIGVIGKIKERKPQSERRDFSVLDENQSIEDLASDSK